MRIDILTLFPEMFAPLKVSLLKRAEEKGILEINLLNIRDFSEDRHKKCDDAPFGGGAGMVMTPQPIVSALRSIEGFRSAKRIYLSPQGETLTQAKVKELSGEEHLILLCGHYEGVDQRVLDLYFPEEISAGDYILTGGELPAMILTDAVCRYVPGVLGSELSTLEESFSEGLLEYPQYTRPQVFEGLEVPEVLRNGNHRRIAEWRKARQEEITKRKRPDLWKEKEE